MADRCSGCGAWLQPDAAFCDACQTAVPGRAAASQPEDDPLRREIPWSDLELDDGRGAPAPATSPTDWGASSFDDRGADPFTAEGDMPVPDLELAAPAKPTPQATFKRPTPSAPSVPPASSSRPGVVREDSFLEHTGEAGTAGGPGVDDHEALALADYGPPPASFFAAIPYTLHVALRLRDLRRGLADARRTRAGAETAYQTVLLELGRQLLAQADELDLAPLDAELNDARRAAAMAEQRNERRTLAEQDTEEQRRTFDARLAQAQAEANPFRDRETKLQTQLSVRENELKRVQARLQRTDIELRNARQAETPDAAQVQMLEADRQARQNEVATAQAPVEALKAELAEVRRQLAGRIGAINQLEDERRRLEKSLARTTTSYVADAALATKDFETRLRSLAEKAHERGLDAPLGPLAERTGTARRALAERRRVEQLHLRAMKLFDRKGVKRGAAVLGGAAFLILVMIVVAIVT